MSFEVVTSPSVVLQLCLGVLRDVTVLEPHTRTRSVERRGDLQCVWRFRQLFADDELAVFVRAGTTCRRDSSTIPKNASTKRTAWCRMWSTSSRLDSPKRVRGSRNSGLVAKRRPPKTFVSP